MEVECTSVPAVGQGSEGVHGTNPMDVKSGSKFTAMKDRSQGRRSRKSNCLGKNFVEGNDLNGF